MPSDQPPASEQRIFHGLANVYFDKSEITDIQGTTGELRYRGYSIDALAADPSYERVAYLLLYGEWPTEAQDQQFRAGLAERRRLPTRLLHLLADLRDTPPAAALRTAISYLGSIRHPVPPFEQDALDLITLVPTIVVAHHALREGRAVPEPEPELDLASDFLRGLLGREPSALERRVINLDFVLHADHGANASTFTARVVVSTEADIYAAFSAAVGALAGRRHGGAVEAVAAMLDELGTAAAVPAFVAEQRARGRALPGFGHRVYRCEDPRARLYRQAVDELSAPTGDQGDGSIIAALIEAMAPYRRLGIGVNDDLYAAVVYRLLGLPVDLASAVFAAGRSAGWAAQILEQIEHNILIRPRLLYAGSPARDLPG